jgi:PST family polysaccharide transporter
LILLDTQYRFVFQLFGITIILYTLNSYFLSIINGYKEFKKFVTISIVTSLLGLIFTVVLVFLFELKGALISTVTYQSVVFFATILMVRKTKWFNKFNFFSKFSYLITKKYLHFSLMAFVTTATVPLSQLFIRSYAIKNISAEQAGWWEAMNRLSGMYLMIITASFGIYYLPRLAELKSKNELRKEIFSAYKIIIPLLLLGFTVIFIFKDLIIKLLFSVEFYPMRDLFFWQLIGDFFKITSWLLAFLMIAKSMTKEFIITEIGSSLLFVSLALFLVNRNGIIGITQAYFINYIIYAFTMSIMFRKTIFYNNRK